MTGGSGELEPSDLGSGDLLADRRYRYASSLLEEGDAAAAADLAAQAIEISPAFAAAWFLLGRAHAERFAQERGPDASGLHRDAVAAFARARELDPQDRLGAGIRLAALGIGDPLDAMSRGYVTALFDEYAGRFDRHLTRSLAYRGPALLADAVRRAASTRLREPAFGEVLDLGCGTGLSGEAIRPAARTLVGVDLSPAMVRKARAKRIYDELHVGDLVAWLGGRPDRSADLAIACDVAVYLGDLAPLWREVARALAPGGLFALTVQSHAGEAVLLGEDGRYAHSEAYLRVLAAQAGLQVALCEAASTRQDRGVDVPGLVIVMGR